MPCGVVISDSQLQAVLLKYSTSPCDPLTAKAPFHRPMRLWSLSDPHHSLFVATPKGILRMVGRSQGGLMRRLLQDLILRPSALVVVRSQKSRERPHSSDLPQQRS